tara:strand:+ start:708 stop:1139 length:432 start_codon:yes stop_codon:yes gene_type:complete
MRRVKSAPENLAKMSHNKKEIKKTSSIFMSSANIPIIIEEKNNNNYKLIKSLKKNVKTMGNLASDAIVEVNYDNYSLEETTLFAIIINYFSNNILKKNKLKEMSSFLAKSFVRYLIMLFIHTQILHDKLDNGILNTLLLPPYI